MITTVTCDNLVAEFATAVVAQREAIMRADLEASEAEVDRYLAAFSHLTRLPGGRDALAVLLDDDRRIVRLAAAAFLLRHCHQRARAVLEVEAEGDDLHALEAEAALANWDRGTWELDPG